MVSVWRELMLIPPPKNVRVTFDDLNSITGPTTIRSCSSCFRGMDLKGA